MTTGWQVLREPGALGAAARAGGKLARAGPSLQVRPLDGPSGTRRLDPQRGNNTDSAGSSGIGRDTTRSPSTANPQVIDAIGNR